MKDFVYNVGAEASQKLNKAKAAIMTSGLLMTLATVPVHADTSTEVWTTAFGRIKPWILNLIIPAALVVCGVFLVTQAVRCYKDYKQTGEVNYGPLVVLIAVIAFLFVMRANDGKLLFQMLGMNTNGSMSNQ